MIENLPDFSTLLLIAIPVIIAITMHEAAHGYAAYLLGDPTAQSQGRMSINPIRHIDLTGTIILPALLLILKSPFLFGWAKPVPVDPSRLNNPRMGMVFVAAAGPGINLALAVISALILSFFSMDSGEYVSIRTALSISVYFNTLMAVFNMIPLPPMDGGRVVVGLLPENMAIKLQRAEPYGLIAILLILFVLPLVSRPLGMEINLFSWIILPIVHAIVDAIEILTNTQMVLRW